jgi:thiamine-monophosphate kinase
MPPRLILGEEQLIQDYLAPLAASAPGAFGLKDDCAMVRPPAGQDLVVTVDAVVSGLHFVPDEAPDVIAWRALAVNISDLASKGAAPYYYLMALTLPEAPTGDWMMQFAGGLKDAQDRYGLTLIGGDTDRRPGVPLSVTITAMGLVPTGKIVLRSTAKVGDRIFVSGTLGDAALGLALRRNPDSKRFATLDKDQRKFLLDRFLRPTPRIELSQLLLDFASSAMDVSDGFAKDLARLCKASGVSAHVDLADLPLSGPAALILADHPEFSDAPASGGDDYEILATVPVQDAAAFEEAALDAGVAVTDIGAIAAGTAGVLLDASGVPIVLAKTGYDHF